VAMGTAAKRGRTTEAEDSALHKWVGADFHHGVPDGALVRIRVLELSSACTPEVSEWRSGLLLHGGTAPRPVPPCPRHLLLDAHGTTDTGDSILWLPLDQLPAALRQRALHCAAVAPLAPDEGAEATVGGCSSVCIALGLHQAGGCKEGRLGGRPLWLEAVPLASVLAAEVAVPAPLAVGEDLVLAPVPMAVKASTAASAQASAAAANPSTLAHGSWPLVAKMDGAKASCGSTDKAVAAAHLLGSSSLDAYVPPLPAPAVGVTAAAGPAEHALPPQRPSPAPAAAAVATAASAAAGDTGRRRVRARGGAGHFGLAALARAAFS